MSVELDQKEEDIYKAKKDRLREYYFPTKEANSPTPQETEKIPRKKRPSIVNSVDPAQLPEVNYSTLGIDVEQLDSTISFNVESFVNDTLGEFGWDTNHEQTLNLDFKFSADNDYLGNQCLELIQKAYKNNNLIVSVGKVTDEKGTTDCAQLEKIQNDFDFLKVVIETVDSVIPKSQIKSNLKAYCKKINKGDSASEFSDVCDIIRDLSQLLKQVESKYIESNPDNEAFTLIAFHRIKHMDIPGITNEHINALCEAIDSFETSASPKEFEKLKKIKKFASFISENLSS